MNDLPRQKLCEIIVQYGRSVCDDPRRCEGLLRDLCPDHRREVFVLASALKERVAAELIASSAGVPYEMLLARLANRLQDNLGLAEDAACWAVETWALALGVISAPQGASLKPKPSVPSGGTPAMAPAPPKPPVSPAATSVIVCQKGGGQFTSITGAIRSVQAGTRILVRPGLYKESLILDKPVEIMGDGPVKEVIVESADSSALWMQTNNASVRGLTLRGRAGSQKRKCCTVEIPLGQLVLEDCDITSDSLACVAIHGSGADPIIRRCQIHNGKSGGVLISENSRGTVEDCEIFKNAGAGVEIERGGNPVIRRCKIHDGKAQGVLVTENSSGTVEDCDIFKNSGAGVEIKESSNPIIRRCKIHDGKFSVFAKGILITEKGRGTVEDCEIFKNHEAGVEIKQGGNPVIRRCKIHDGMRNGVLVTEEGQGTVEDCDIFRNAWAGVKIQQAGNPVIQRCKIHDGKKSGIGVDKNGEGTVEACDISGNAKAGTAIKRGGNPAIRQCKIHNGNRIGVLVYGKGKGIIEHCDIVGNTKDEVIVIKGSTPTISGGKTADQKVRSRATRMSLVIGHMLSIGLPAAYFLSFTLGGLGGLIALDEKTWEPLWMMASAGAAAGIVWGVVIWAVADPWVT
jgi:parallel beta-helix repeat protein